MHKLSRLTVVLGVLVLAMLAAGVVAAQGNAQPLTVDVPVTGEITHEQAESLYTFEGSAGDVIAISMTANAPGLDSFLELVLPDGTSAMTDDDSGGSLNSLLGPYTLPQDGTYTVHATRFGRADGGSTGAFTLLLQYITPQTITVGEGVTVTVNDAQPFAFLTFDGAEANRVYDLEAEPVAGANTSSYGVNVRDANGIINSGFGQSDRSALLSGITMQPGQSYTVTVIRQDESGIMPPSGREVRTILTLRAVEPQPLAMGESVSGTLDDATPARYYRISVTAGQILRLEGTHDESGLPVDAQVVNSAGIYMVGANSFYDMAGQPNANQFTIDPLTVNVTDDYILTIRRFDPETGGMTPPANSTSQFTLTLGDTQTPVLELGQAVAGTATMYGAAQVYRFEGAAGQTVAITLEGLDDVYAPALDVQGPRIATADPSTGMGQMNYLLSVNSTVNGKVRFDVTLPADGLYLFNVRLGGPYEMVGEPAAMESATGQFSLVVESAQ